ncbi:oxygen-independent coproporphyrinogen III oxidase [Microvirga lotononidis]|uniref:Coproporphyrinogen-III oxidase n=1 Tax=Microvirga lotononidis TaxID=864069 RepID=I4Z0N9_9HYPH|nr:oxygen-independent coproporphyrinogen III oxidase [Microvirga lotononidis]EIM29781.1 oxygen-independent coproporphyrinogen III oxidase [Microvirga lotononidis]WQO26921.1 oxygen-independent coproporphyrinogen III oxidase [Microvirga lotononidis]
MTPELIARYDQRVPRYTSYPTAPHFKPDVTAGTYASWLAELAPDRPLSLYLHVPFCAELCLYCGCNTAVTRSYKAVAAYVACLEHEIDLVASHLPGRMAVSHVHWGGGTPTILSPDDLRRISRRLALAFSIRPEAEIAVEIDPRTITPEHVEALAASGLNRASLGVQDFDPKVQETIGRVQTFEQTARVASWLRDAGVNGLNLDLMYGLPHQSIESVNHSVDLALKLDPDRIALFGYAHVPWMKRHQALLPETSLPDSVARVEQREAATEAFIRAGYVQIGLDHFAKPDDPMAVRQKDGRLHRNFQGYTTDEATALIGFGTSAIGSLPQGYIQNAPTTVAYREAILKDRLPVVRGVTLSQDDRLRRAIIERLMCDFSVDLDEIASSFGAGIGGFAPEITTIDALARDGLVVRHGLTLTIPDEGRALVRNVCAVFDRYLESGAERHSRAL